MNYTTATAIIAAYNAVWLATDRLERKLYKAKTPTPAETRLLNALQKTLNKEVSHLDSVIEVIETFEATKRQGVRHD